MSGFSQKVFHLHLRQLEDNDELYRDFFKKTLDSFQKTLYNPLLIYTEDKGFEETSRCEYLCYRELSVW